MRSGPLRQQVTLEQTVEFQNNRGETITSWIAVAPVWASIEPLTGRKLELARQQYATVTHLLDFHYRPGVTSKMRFTLNGRVFDIEGVLNENERNRNLIAAVTERNL